MSFILNHANNWIDATVRAVPTIGASPSKSATANALVIAGPARVPDEPVLSCSVEKGELPRLLEKIRLRTIVQEKSPAEITDGTEGLSISEEFLSAVVRQTRIERAMPDHNCNDTSDSREPPPHGADGWDAGQMAVDELFIGSFIGDLLPDTAALFSPTIPSQHRLDIFAMLTTREHRTL